MSYYPPLLFFRESLVFLFLFLFLFFKFTYLFIYLFLAVLGLRFCARAFSSCGEWGPLFIAVRGPLTVVASLVAEHRLQTRRLSSCGSRAQLLRGMWDLPRPGLEPVSPALAGRLSTTAPPGKPRIISFWLRHYSTICAIGEYQHFFLIDLYWSIIASQYCVSFCVHQSESAICILMSPYPLPLEPPSHPPYSTPLGHRKAPSWSPCAMVLLPTS